MKKLKAQYSIILMLLVVLVALNAKKDISTEKKSKIPESYLLEDRKVASDKNPPIKKKLKKLKKEKTISIPRVLPIREAAKNVARLKDFKIVYGKKINGNSFIQNLSAVEDTAENRKIHPDYIVKNKMLLVKGSRGLSIVETPNKELGIFTKVLSIKVKNGSVGLFDELKNYAYTIKAEFPHIKVYHIQFDQDQDTIDAYNSLKNSQFVERITIEILDHEFIKK